MAGGVGGGGGKLLLIREMDHPKDSPSRRLDQQAWGMAIACEMSSAGCEQERRIGRLFT